jgi:UDP-N-acetylmuramate dehydrogenase
MKNNTININFQENVLLSDLTTIKLGGKAKLFYNCETTEDIKKCLLYAESKNTPLQVISGGSNIIFPDEGFAGIVIKIDIKGIEFNDPVENVEEVTAGAGENWDDFVKLCIENDLTGVECLSGIPGYVGATPIQNLGAYGQEVCDTIVSVEAIDRNSYNSINFTNKECKFGYRQSRFKNEDKDKFIITGVTYSLRKFSEPEIKHIELRKRLNEKTNMKSISNGKEKLTVIRDNVIDIRKSKSMMINSSDPNTVSCGSFFLNPLLSIMENKQLESLCSKYNLKFPSYKTKEGIKISAAWLIENSGFYKGIRKWGAGISENHSLALINCGGSSKELLDLSEDIEETVYSKFNIKLIREPVIVRNR